MGALRILRSQVRKDLTIWYRRPVIIVATVASPLAYIFVIFFVSFTVGRNPVALVVDGQGPQAARLASVLAHSQSFITHRMSGGAAQQALTSMDVEAVIAIPVGFDAALSAGHGVVRMTVNNVNADEADDLRRSLPAALADFDASYRRPLSIQLAERDVHRRDFTLGQFVFIPICVFIITVAGIMCSGLIATQEWESGTINELLLAPVGRWVVVVAKLLAGWVQTMLLASVVVTVGAAAGFLRITSAAVLPCVVVLLLVGLASAGGGIALGFLFRRIGALYAYGIQVAVVMFFLSGGMSVIGFLPGIVQRLARYVPMYYPVHALDREVLYPTTGGVTRDIAVIGLVALAAAAASIGVFRRQVLD